MHLRSHLLVELGSPLAAEKRYNELIRLIEFISYVRTLSINFMQVLFVRFIVDCKLFRHISNEEFDLSYAFTKLPPFVLDLTREIDKHPKIEETTKRL